MTVSYKDVRLLPPGRLTDELMTQEMHDDDHEDLHSWIRVSSANEAEDMQKGDGIAPMSQMEAAHGYYVLETLIEDRSGHP